MAVTRFGESERRKAMKAKEDLCRILGANHVAMLLFFVSPNLGDAGRSLHRANGERQRMQVLLPMV